MNDFKSVQDLIVKAALYDGISTTISPHKVSGDLDVLKITFSKGIKRSATYIDVECGYMKPEEAALYACKNALHRLLWGPYEEIEYKKEN